MLQTRIRCFRYGYFILILLCIAATAVFAEAITVSDLAYVEDTALRDGEYAGWNFGSGPYLETGFMGGIYAEYHCVSLVRFNLSHINCSKVNSAKLRLYKPKCFVQTAPVPIEVYAVAKANSGWSEGKGFCSEDAKGSCWQSISGGKVWVGKEGCSVEGVGYQTPALDTRIAPDDRGERIEFNIPAELVRKWLDHPESNSGLLIKAKKTDGNWGNHVFFYSSEHYAGKGPQLVIDGQSFVVQTDIKAAKVRQELPQSDEMLDKWLAANRRLAGFAKAVKMNREQAKVFFYFDTTLRKDLIVERYQAPLEKLLGEMDALIAKGDEKALRVKLQEFRKTLLVWEYIRETSWYTAGPVADVLSPLQLGIFFGQSIFGRMEEGAKEKGREIWVVPSDKELQDHVNGTVESTGKKLGLTSEEINKIKSPLAEYERLEQEYLAKFRKDLARTQELITAKSDDAEMFNIVRSLHLNHELFLYYQSLYNTPRWLLFMEKAPVIPLGKWVVEGRKKNYTKGRIESQIKDVKQYSPAETAE